MTPLRVLLLSTYYAPVIGGSETHARQLAVCLQHAGVLVEVLTKRIGSAPAREVIDGVTVHRIGPPGPRSAAQKWLMLPSIAAAMIKRRHDFDAVLCPDYRGVGFAAIPAARLIGWPSVMATAALGVVSAANVDPTLQRFGLSPSGILARVAKWPLRRVYGMASAYPAITRAIQREAVASGLAESRVPYLPNSVDVQRFRPPAPGERDQIRRAEHWPTDRTICLFLARLSREKGLMDLVAAWRQVHRPDALLFIGGPDMEGHSYNVGPDARAFVAANGLQDCVRFLGPTAAPDRWLRAADAFVQPSHWEAAPFGVIEAMATALPIVATRVGGMSEYLIDDHNGLLCEAQHPAALARQLERVLAEPPLRQRLGNAARATAEQEFDERVICAKYIALIRDLVAKARGGRPTSPPVTEDPS